MCIYFVAAFPYDIRHGIHETELEIVVREISKNSYIRFSNCYEASLCALHSGSADYNILSTYRDAVYRLL